MRWSRETYAVLRHCKAIHACYCCYWYVSFRLIKTVLIPPVCHPALRTDWFLKLGDSDHTRALTVFRHVYEEYASRISPPEDTATTYDESDADSDSGILGSAAARPFVEQVSSMPESPSEFTRWVTNEGGPGKMNYPLVWWKVRHWHHPWCPGPATHPM
jgi:hypothetical protein